MGKTKKKSVSSEKGKPLVFRARFESGFVFLDVPSLDAFVHAAEDSLQHVRSEDGTQLQVPKKDLHDFQVDAWRSYYGGLADVGD